MPRKPTDDSNSPRSGGRGRDNAGRPARRGTTDRSGGADRAARSGSAGRGVGGDRPARRGTTDRSGGADRAARSGSAGRGVGGDRPARRGATDRSGGADRAVRSGSAGRVGGNGGRPARWGSADRSGSADRAARNGPVGRGGTVDHPARRGSTDRGGGVGRDVRRGPTNSAVRVDRPARRGAAAPGSRKGGGGRESGRDAGSSGWNSSSGRRGAGRDTRSGDGSDVRSGGRLRGYSSTVHPSDAGAGPHRSGGPQIERPTGGSGLRGRGKRASSRRDRTPRRDEPPASVVPTEDRQAAPESWGGRPSSTQHAASNVAGQVRKGRREEGERIQKALSRAGLASRREVEDWIRAGRISVNGELAVLGARVEPSDHVRLDGRLIRQRETGGSARVFLIHRSPGENLQQPVEASDQSSSDGSSEVSDGVEAQDDERGSSAPSLGTPLLDRIPRRAGRRFIPVSPMPRVDGGLELVTSDGDLAAKLQRSMRRLSSEFSVRVHGELSSQGLETVTQGMLDTGEKLEIERCEAAGGEGSNRWYSVVARGASGKDVRQLFERQGALVSRVLRTQLGSLALDRHLSRGRFRELSAEELEALLVTAGGGGL
jgi:23S rRNA pseudouridine2605 synthase